jgi:hypothetical protein
VRSRSSRSSAHCFSADLRKGAQGQHRPDHTLEGQASGCHMCGVICTAEEGWQAGTQQPLCALLVLPARTHTGALRR